MRFTKNSGGLGLGFRGSGSREFQVFWGLGFRVIIYQAYGEKGCGELP